MLAFLLSSVLNRLLTLVLLSVVAFSLARSAPGDPAEITLRATGEEPSPEAISKVRSQLGLDRSLPEQYAAWAGRVMLLDFGISFASRRPVVETFLDRLPATLELAGAALALTALIGLGGGLLAAFGRHGWLDWSSRIVAMLGASLPTYWVGLILTFVFGVILGWLPVAGREGLQHLILPALTLAFASSALQLRLFRAGLLLALSEPFAIVARAKGLSHWQVLFRHALPRALGPNLQALGVSAGHMLGGAVVTETVFAWPGVGRLAVESVFRRDFPIIQSYVIIVGAAYIALNLLADLAHAWCDPAVRGAVASGTEAEL